MIPVARLAVAARCLAGSAVVVATIFSLTSCASVQNKATLQRADISGVSIRRQDLEWINDVSRQVLVDPKIHDFAERGVRPLVDSVWYAVIEEARNNPTGPRRSFAQFAASLDGLEHDEKSRRVHAWFLGAGWALWGQPSRQHPDLLLRLNGKRFENGQFNDALERVFGEYDADFHAPWLVDVSSQPMMAWSSPGLSVLNLPQIASTSARLYGSASSQRQHLKRVVAGLTMVEEAVQWRFNQLGREFKPGLEQEALARDAQFTRRNYIQIVAMAVAFNIDNSALDLYDIQMRQCRDRLKSDGCRHLLLMADEFKKRKIDQDTTSNARFGLRREKLLSADAELAATIRQRYTRVARQILEQIY